MSTLDMYNLEEAIDFISSIGGYDPQKEVEELREYAINSNNTDHEEYFNSLISRRLNHEPVAYITNHSKFRELDLYIDERVLIPRTETEPLIEVATQELSHGARVVDVGTGSGAVALALKSERPDLEIMGVDISKDALDVAAINSSALELDIKWKDADLLEGVREEFDAVLANMPYLPTTKRDSYEPEMVEHEPQVALWGGSDGYDLIRRLLALVKTRKSVKFIALEIGLGQEVDVCELVRTAGFPTVFCTTDSRDQIRAVIGRK